MMTIKTEAKIEPTKIKRVLAIHMGGIGNLLLFVPALKTLRDGFSKASIHLLVARWGAEQVVAGSSMVDQVLIYDNRWSLRRKTRFVKSLRQEKFDVAVVATGINPLKAGILTYLSGIPWRLGEDRGWRSFLYTIKSVYDDRIHEVEANLNLIKSIGFEVRNRDLFIPLSSRDSQFSATFLKSAGVEKEKDLIIGLHPGCGKYQDFKRWPKHNFADLADILIRKLDAKVIIFGGTEEIELAGEVSNLMKGKPVIAAGKTTLRQAAALIKSCRIFITNDSGLMHLACAVHTPVAAIFGPTDYRRIGPYGDSAVIIRKELDCSPCYIKGRVRCEREDCFKAVTVDEVFQVADRLLKESMKSDDAT